MTEHNDNQPDAPASAEDVLAHLDEALDSLMAARVLVGGVPAMEVPAVALDEALAGDDAYQAARKRFRGAWESLAELVDGGETNPVMLTMEESVNAMAVAATDVGWRLGVTTQRGDLQPSS